MQFTLSTMRTPASVRETTRDLRFRLPIIVMDGAALYDMGQKRYLHTCVLPKELALRCEAVFQAQGVHCFLNGVLDDNLMIYYGEFHHETERAIFEKLRTSPYRNYVSRRYFKDCPIVYLMGIDLTERMQALYDALEAAGLLDQVKVRFYPSAQYPGYSYLKLYERSASREAMLERLKQEPGHPEERGADHPGGLRRRGGPGRRQPGGEAAGAAVRALYLGAEVNGVLTGGANAPPVFPCAGKNGPGGLTTESLLCII